jgi:membrane-bound lytic murein transglycosylase F
LKAILLSLITTASVSWAVQSSSSEPFSSYDSYFARYATRYMPEHDWRWLKAQCYQESLLNPTATSHVGARGICQFMPPTWVEYQEAFETSVPATVAKANIQAAAWYMMRMERVWSGRRRKPYERLPLAQASYNCGAGCVIQAQARCGDKRNWIGVKPCLPEETKHYVPLIEYHYNNTIR